jgi:thioredoxin 1
MPLPEMTTAEVDEVVAAGTPLVVQLATPWCTQCPTQKTVVEGLQAEWDGVRVGLVDLAGDVGLADRYDVSTVPAFLLFVDGRHEATLRGFQRAAQLRHAVRPLLVAAS